MWAIVDNNTVTDILVHPKGIRRNGGLYPESIFRLWSITQLATIGIYPVTNGSLPTKFENIINTSYVFNTVTNTVDETHIFQDKSLINIRDMINKEINALTSNVIIGGIDHYIDGISYTFDTDLTSLSNLNGISTSILGGYTLPAGFSWRTRDNINVIMDASKIKTLREAITTKINDAYTNSWAHKANVDLNASLVDIDLLNESQQYIDNNYPTDLSNYPLVVAQAIVDNTTEIVTADNIIATIPTRTNALKILDVSTGWPSIPVMIV